MATGRIGVTPTLGTRWSKAPAGGTTSLSGLDDNSVALVYSVGYEQVYRNGVLLSRGNDYTATSGNSITLTDATIAGDIIEVFANELVPLTDAISKGQFTAKGALLSATAASTPGVLTVGSNDQVLTADSSTATGLKWATPSSGSKTLLSTTTLSSNVTTISSISGAYTDLYVEVYGYTFAASSYVWINLNSATNNTTTVRILKSATAVGGDTNTQIYAQDGNSLNTDSNNSMSLYIYNYSDTTKYKNFYQTVGYLDSSSIRQQQFRAGTMQTNSALTSIQITSGSTFSSGTVKIWGIK